MRGSQHDVTGPRSLTCLLLVLLAVAVLSTGLAGTVAADPLDVDLEVEPETAESGEQTSHDVTAQFDDVDRSTEEPTVTVTLDEASLGATDAASFTAANESDDVPITSTDVTDDQVTLTLADDGVDDSLTVTGTLIASYETDASDATLTVDLEGVTTGTTVSVVDGAAPAYDPGLAYEGQSVTVTSDRIDGDETYALRRVDETDDGLVSESSHETDLTVETDGELTVDTAGLDADDYFVSGPGLPTPDSDDTLEVTAQDLEITVDDEADPETELEIDSRRSGFDANVSADGDLDAGELLALAVDDETLAADLASEEARSYVSFDPDTETVEVDEDITEHLETDDGDVTDLEGERFSDANPFGAFAYDDVGSETDETIVLVDVDSREATVDASTIDEGSYDLTVDVVDTVADDSVTLTVDELDVDAAFDQEFYGQPAGDLVRFDLELEDTDEAYVQFGDEEAGFVDILYVEDETETDTVTFWVNTRAIGTDATVDSESVYDAGDDTVESLLVDEDGHATGAFATVRFLDEDLAPLETDLADDGRHVGAYLEELEVVGDERAYDRQLDRPLQPTEYTLRVTDDGRFVADEDGETVVANELESAVLGLTPPGLGDATTMVAPAGEADSDDPSELREQATERSTVAEGDRLIVEVEASGLLGALTYEEGDWDTLEDGYTPSSLAAITDGSTWAGEGVTVDVVATETVGNQEPTRLDLESAAKESVAVFAEPDDGTILLVIDTGATDAFTRGLDGDEQLTVDVLYETHDDDWYAYETRPTTHPAAGGAGGDSEQPSYPYLDPGSDERASASVDLVEPDISFDNRDENGSVQLHGHGLVQVTGETTVAPRSDAEIRVSNADDNSTFFATTDAEIDAEGTVDTDGFDVDGREVGADADIEYRVAGRSIADTDGQFVDRVETETTEDTEDTETDEPSLTVDVDTPASVEQNETATLEIAVENPGEEPATSNFTMFVDDEVIAASSIDVDAGEVSSTTVDVEADDQDEIDWEFRLEDDVADGTITVDAIEQRADQEPSSATGEDEMPAPGPVFVIGSLLTAWVLGSRRK